MKWLKRITDISIINISVPIISVPINGMKNAGPGTDQP